MVVSLRQWHPQPSNCSYIQGDTQKKPELTKSLTTHELLFRLKQKFYRIMYKLCCQHLQSLNSVRQKLFVLQPLKDMFQNCSPAQPQVQPRVVTALTRPEPLQTSLCCVTSRTGCMGTTPRPSLTSRQPSQ